MWSRATVFHPVGAKTGLIGAVAGFWVSGQDGVWYPSLQYPSPKAGAANNMAAAATFSRRNALPSHIVLLMISRFGSARAPFMGGLCRSLCQNSRRDPNHRFRRRRATERPERSPGLGIRGNCDLELLLCCCPAAFRVEAKITWEFC